MTADCSSDVSRTPVVFLVARLLDHALFARRHGPASGARLSARFTSLCRTAIEARSGRVTGVRGDGVTAVFSSAREALWAAADIQTYCAVERTAKLPLRP